MKLTPPFGSDIWVFAYGSLMWHPDFEYEEAQVAEVEGYHRDLCILSYVFRGTPHTPGLVMGLNPGGHCVGRVFRIAPENVAVVFEYLDAREMIHQVYEPTWLTARLRDGTKIAAYGFVTVAGHEQHVGHFNEDEKVSHVLQGFGQRGSALEYLENTCDHLRELGIHDAALEGILSQCRKRVAQKG